MKAPTVAEQRWMDDIVRLGCIICLIEGRGESLAEVHHLLSGGRRISHRHSIPLCFQHHRGGRNDADVVSRDQTQRRFEMRYRSEAWLLAETQRRVAELRALQVGATA